ncbi:MAG: LytR C-terminal domain-containing protein [Gemmatimonadaceae bacterium]|nr:LytR C-terminal domain-containing protein [Gemmatimonadaceae bacterium]
MEFDPIVPQRIRRRWGRIVLAAVVVVGVGVGAVVRRGARPRVDASAPTPGRVEVPERVIPDTVRVKVEVLNASDVRGLARRATEALRDAGFDVVAIGTVAKADYRDSVLVLDRSGHADWAALAVRTMRQGRAEARPDSSRYVDLTVLIGRRWTPPRQAFDP